MGPPPQLTPSSTSYEVNDIDAASDKAVRLAANPNERAETCYRQLRTRMAVVTTPLDVVSAVCTS